MHDASWVHANSVDQWHCYNGEQDLANAQGSTASFGYKADDNTALKRNIVVVNNRPVHKGHRLYLAPVDDKHAMAKAQLLGTSGGMRSP